MSVLVQDSKKAEQLLDTVRKRRVRNLVSEIQQCLDDSLRQPRYQGNPNALAGHCYVASEAFYHLDNSEEWKPMFIRHEGEPHWFLKHRFLPIIIDITAKQFKLKPKYDKAKGKGFLTKSPSKRCQKLINKIKERRENKHV